MAGGTFCYQRGASDLETLRRGITDHDGIAVTPKLLYIYIFSIGFRITL